MANQHLLTTTLVELADTLVEDFDVIDLLTLLVARSVEILAIQAAGLMLAAPEGGLQLAASSSEGMRVVELFELQSREGPCMDCHRTGEPVLNEVLDTTPVRWPVFAGVALDAGFRSVHAVPMRLRGTIIGALNLFSAGVGQLSTEDVLSARALADMATISILHNRSAVAAQAINAQLNHALTSRIVIEQAKGMVAERVGIDVEEAFTQLRAYARNRNLLLVDVARAVTDGALLDLGSKARPEPAPPA